MKLLALTLVMALTGCDKQVAIIVYNDPPFQPSGDSPRVVATKTDLNNLYQGAVLYKLDTGAYPAVLNDMVPRYMTKIPADCWDRHYVYENLGKTIKLSSAGEDGVIGTFDDVVHVKAVEPKKWYQW